MAIIVFSFVEYLPEDGRKRPKYAGRLPHVRVLFCLILMQFLEYIYIYIYMMKYKKFLCGSGSSVGIAIAYGLDGPGIKSRWGRDFSHLSRPALRPTQPPVQWIPGLSRA